MANSTVLTHLPLRGQRRNRGSTVYKCAHSPASLFHSVDPWVTEHLKQAAKVSGLGVERQLKPARLILIIMFADTQDVRNKVRRVPAAK